MIFCFHLYLAKCHTHTPTNTLHSLQVPPTDSVNQVVALIGRSSSGPSSTHGDGNCLFYAVLQAEACADLSPPLVAAPNVRQLQKGADDGMVALRDHTATTIQGSAYLRAIVVDKYESYRRLGRGIGAQLPVALSDRAKVEKFVDAVRRPSNQGVFMWQDMVWAA